MLSLTSLVSVDCWSVVALSLTSFSSADDSSVVMFSLVAFSSVDGCSVVSVVEDVLSWFVTVWSDSAAFASSCPAPKINVAPTKIDAAPTVNFLIEYLFWTLGKKSNLLFGFFFK